MPSKKALWFVFLLILGISTGASGVSLSKRAVSLNYPFSGRAVVKIGLTNDYKEPLIFQSVYKP